jgi:hypothetical protein
MKTKREEHENERRKKKFDGGYRIAHSLAGTVHLPGHPSTNNQKYEREKSGIQQYTNNELNKQEKQKQKQKQKQKKRKKERKER